MNSDLISAIQSSSIFTVFRTKAEGTVTSVSTGETKALTKKFKVYNPNNGDLLSDSCVISK